MEDNDFLIIILTEIEKLWFSVNRQNLYVLIPVEICK